MALNMKCLLAPPKFGSLPDGWSPKWLEAWGWTWWIGFIQWFAGETQGCCFKGAARNGLCLGWSPNFCYSVAIGSHPWMIHEWWRFGKGNNPTYGDLLTMVINHLQVLGMIFQVGCCFQRIHRCWKTKWTCLTDLKSSTLGEWLRDLRGILQIEIDDKNQKLVLNSY